MIQVSEARELVINPDFEKLIPPLAAEEFEQLEKNILAEGVRDPLVVWNDVIIDGHNRYKIATKHNLGYSFKEIAFKSNDEAEEWIILNQFGRRNLPAYTRGVLALKLKSIYAERAKQNLVISGKTFGIGATDKGLENSTNPIKPIDTRKEIAKKAQVSDNTIYKIEKIEEKAPKEIKEKLRAEEISINQAYQAIVKGKAHVSNNSGDNEWYTPPCYIESARKVMGSIDLDPASSETANKVIKAKTYFNESENGLVQAWKGNIWMNPPYAQPLIYDFILKLETETYNQAIVLVNNATETKWGQKLMELSSAVCFHTGRIRFVSPDGELGDAPLQGQMIAYIGQNYREFMAEFRQYGICLRKGV